MTSRPNGFAFANSALSSMGHLATESFKRAAGVEAVVCCRGTAPTPTDVVSGGVTLMVAPLGSAPPHLTGGGLRAYAAMGPRRSPRAPGVPTIAGQEMPGLDFTLWYALWAPEGLPEVQADRLRAAAETVSREPAMAAHIGEQGAEVVAEDRAAFARVVAAEAERDARIAQRAGGGPE